MKTTYSALAAAWLLATGPAMAAGADFQTCDGYPAPTAKGDGMTTSTFLFGLASQNEDIRRSRAVEMGVPAVDACERALSDPLLLPAFQLRRAHLLQAKALYQIASGTPQTALETLAASDAIGATIAGNGFRDSLAIGNRAVRAYALTDLGRTAEALGEADAVEAARPYAHSIVALANIVRLHLDSTLDAQLALLKRQAPLFPNGLLGFFDLALDANRLTEVAEIGDDLTFELPRTRGGWTVEGEEALQYQLIAARAEIAGAHAYALAATGKPDAAATVIAAARQDLDEAMVPPPAPPPGKKLSRRLVADFDSRSTQGRLGVEALDIWTRLISLRKDAAGMAPQPFFDVLKTFPKGRVPVIIDLVTQLRIADARDDAARQSFLSEIRSTINRRRLSDIRSSPSDLREALPRPETAAMQPRFKLAGDGYFLSDNGFSRRRMDDADKWTIRFTHHLASAATVEELALLSAAKQAERDGYDGLLVLTSRTLVRTTRMISYWSGTSELPAGREGQLTVLFVRQGALPQAYRDRGWRLLKTGEIIAALSARYPATQPPSAGTKP